MSKNILITSAGRRVSLLNYFKKEAASLLGGQAKVYTTDLHPEMSTACLASDKGFKVGRFSDPDYMQDILTICLDHQIKLIVPTIDTELLLLAEHRKTFQEHGIEIVVSDPAFIKTCRDKLEINTFFAKRGFLLPKEIDRAKPEFPLFIKPRDGSNSNNLHFINEASKLSDYLVNNENLIWMEYLSPKEYTEYTVDLYYDKQGSLKCIVPRIRLVVRGGETNKGITQKDPFLLDFISQHLKNIPGARGCLTLQLFLGSSNQQIYGIEINPRFGGGYPLSYLAGANYPGWLIQEYLLSETIDFFEDWEDKLLLLRHDNEVIIHDFDA